MHIYFRKSSDLILTTEHPSTMNVVIIVCGPRFNEAIQTMKSILMFSGSNIQFIIFVDEENKPLFKDTGVSYRNTLTVLTYLKHSSYCNAAAVILTSDLPHSMTTSKKVPRSDPLGHRDLLTCHN